MAGRLSGQTRDAARRSPRAGPPPHRPARSSRYLPASRSRPERTRSGDWGPQTWSGVLPCQASIGAAVARQLAAGITQPWLANLTASAETRDRSSDDEPPDRFVAYSPKSILNKAKRADHWFWTRYSAYPYIGCQHGCAFCYCRERKYAPYDDPEDFAHLIKVKQNAPGLLRRALSRVPVDLVFTGDYQPAERKFQISRRMLEVCLELGFPVFVLERSPLVLRDLDLLQDINRRAPSVVAFSILTTPDAPSYAQVRQVERLAPRAGETLRGDGPVRGGRPAHRHLPDAGAARDQRR